MVSLSWLPLLFCSLLKWAVMCWFEISAVNLLLIYSILINYVMVANVIAAWIVFRDLFFWVNEELHCRSMCGWTNCRTSSPETGGSKPDSPLWPQKQRIWLNPNKHVMSQVTVRLSLTLTKCCRRLNTTIQVKHCCRHYKQTLFSLTRSASTLQPTSG